MTLCRICQRLDLKNFVDWDKTLEDVAHHSSLDQLQQSAPSCSLCNLILDSLLPKLFDPDYSLDAAAWKNSPIKLRGVQYVDDNEDSEAGGIFWIKARCDRAGPLAYAFFSLYPDPNGPPISEDIVIGRKIRHPEQNYDLLQGWIQDCSANHPSCHTAGPLPTRVINVGLAGDDYVRLQVTTLEDKSPYMTLSHCWGPNPHLIIRTTSTTLAQHLQRIPLSSLTNTFRDAVLITRAVGIPYLWIDSLCIIQDSAADWALESARMGFIYANSYLTIAAAASPDSTGGCFHHNNPLPHHENIGPKIKCTLPSGIVSHVHLTPRLGDFLTLHASPLHTRAWVKQERILSPRTVHYDVDQLLWECRTCRLTESGVPEKAFVTQKLVWDGRLHLTEIGKHRPFYWDWYDLVSSYTGHGLTKGADKLPALSGLAQMLEQATGKPEGGYVAGLWREHLAMGLLWRKVGPWLRTAEEGYRAPSWSWAAWDGKMSFYGEADLEGGAATVVEDVEGLEAVVTPAGLDPRGRLSGGWLSVTGAIKAADQRMDPRGEGYEKLPGVMESLELTVDYIKDKGATFGIAFYDEEYVASSGPVYLLRIGTMENSRGQRLPSLFHALLLQPTGNKDEFRRIGIAEQREVGTGRHRGPLESQPDFFADAPRKTITVV